MELPKRKPNRLNGYDYSKNAAYFITMCVKDRNNLLWDVGARVARLNDDVEDAYKTTSYKLSQYGIVVENAIQNIPLHYPIVIVDKYVVMPNHIHLIMVIDNDNGRAMRAPTISTVINQTKGYVTKKIGFSIWQKLFHDRIIRNEHEYQNIWQYIHENPSKWEKDCFYIN